MRQSELFALTSDAKFVVSLSHMTSDFVKSLDISSGERPYNELLISSMSPSIVWSTSAAPILKPESSKLNSNGADGGFIHRSSSQVIKSILPFILKLVPVTLIF